MDFDKAFEIVVGLEGGYVNDPKDPGGETKYGIAKRYHPNIDIANLSLSQAKSIYLVEYWNIARCDDVADGLKLIQFDTAVNMSPEDAITLLQRALKIKDDGKFGPITLKAAKNNSDETYCLYGAERVLEYISKPGLPDFGRGWFKRLFSVTLQR